MDTASILNALRAERSRIDQAIAALEQLDGIGKSPVRAGRPAESTPTAPTRSRRRMSAAARKRISEPATARWAARKQGAGTPKTAAKKAVPAHRGMSAAARKRMSEMMKKRWAERKKAV